MLSPCVQLKSGSTASPTSPTQIGFSDVGAGAMHLRHQSTIIRTSEQRRCYKAATEKAASLISSSRCLITLYATFLSAVIYQHFRVQGVFHFRSTTSLPYAQIREKRWHFSCHFFNVVTATCTKYTIQNYGNLRINLTSESRCLSMVKFFRSFSEFLTNFDILRDRQSITVVLIDIFCVFEKCVCLPGRFYALGVIY